MNKEAYAPFEIEHGFDSDRALRNEESRASEFEIKAKPATANPPLPGVTLMSKSQWRKTRHRKVIVSDEQAKRVIVTKTGYHLHLFDESQTVQSVKKV